MWCSDCGQDVPGVASPSNPHDVVCARCGESFSGSTRATDTISTASVAQSTDQLAKQETKVRDTLNRPFLEFDDWGLDDDLAAAEEALRGFESGLDQPAPSSPPHFAANGAAANGAAETVAATTMTPSPTPIYHFHPAHGQPTVPERPRQRKPSLLGWTLVTFGMVGFACGAVLTGWSLAAGRTDLWTMGVPTFLLGQAALLVGMIFQMEGLWKNNHQAQKSLDDLDQRLSHLNQSTKLIGTTQSGPSQAFHTHMAEGAHPHLLLSDLKGQLDLLTTQLASERRQ